MIVLLINQGTWHSSGVVLEHSLLRKKNARIMIFIKFAKYTVFYHSGVYEFSG